MTFANPNMLFLLAFIVLLPLMFIYYERSRSRILRTMAAGNKPVMILGASFEIRLIHLLFLCFGIAFLVLAAARPRWGTKLETVSHRGIDIMIAVDVSESMRAEDVSPNRILKARQEVEKLLQLLKGDRVGLIAFAGSAFAYCPLTVDYAAVRLFLSGLEPGIISDGGTDIGAAVNEAVATFERSNSNAYKVLVVFSDGEHHENDPGPAVELAVEKGVQVFTVGIGNVTKAERIPMVDEEDQEAGYKKDQQGNLVITRLDETTLQNIATAGNGQYFRVSESGTELVRIYRELEAQEETEFTSRLHHQKEDRYQIPLLIAIAFFSVAYSLGSRSYKKMRRTQGVFS